LFDTFVVGGPIRTSSSVMAERPRDACASTVQGFSFRLNFRWENGYTTTMLLEVFTQRNRNFIVWCYSTQIEFYWKDNKNRFWATLWGT